ncbi:MAG TPA: hypothetical protein VIV40_43940 [Kofleriaceae bacterium]
MTAVAHGNPRALPMTYTTDTQPAGGAELELFADLVPLRAISPTTTEETSYLASAFQLELEIGLADRLELGLYATFVPSLGDQLAGTAQFAGAGNGLKQRLRYTLNPEPDSVPILGNAAAYVEIAENEREIELEAKLLIERRLDRVRIAANLSAEYELYFSGQREWVLNPSAGATYEVTPRYHVGLDGFLRAEYPQHPAPDARTFGLGPHVYVGPAVLLAFDKGWWSLGAYGRLTSPGHDLDPGEPYGRVWIRSAIGFDL